MVKINMRKIKDTTEQLKDENNSIVQIARESLQYVFGQD